jgi:diaminopimelate epimerase
MDELASRLDALRGMPFAKMTGSGNDFVFFDGREVPSHLVTAPEVIVAICNRFNGIGADGLVVLEPAEPEGNARIVYFNSDGSPADLCGNATLCSTSLSVELGLGRPEQMSLLTAAGSIVGRVQAGLPEIDLQPVSDVRTQIDIPLDHGEQRIGFALAGIPHLVILCADADAIDLAWRGPGLRSHPSLGAGGANVNWVSPRPDGTWRYRTFERGVEGETLACGTGAVATAILLSAWGLAATPVAIRTSSQRILDVRLTHPAGNGGAWLPSLRGEGRVVFRGRIESLGASS